jgi:SAM-dependent methyltransferase
MPRNRLINDHRTIWGTKPVLRAIYADYHKRIAAQCISGPTLEIGGGGGEMNLIIPDIISIDIQFASWIDTVADAQSLPFRDDAFSNIVMVDVLHHLPSPKKFLAEVLRVLLPGGRLIMIEPEITPLSYVLLSVFHPEPVLMSADPLADFPQTGPKPEDANQAIPHLLFRRYGQPLSTLLPKLCCVQLERLSLWAYPLSGGFRRWCLLPRALVGPLLKIEDLLLPFLGRLAAFRLFIVMERKP